MTARGVLNLAMLAVVIVLAWLSLRDDRGDAERELSALTGIDGEQVSRIRLERGSGAELDFERSPNGWQMRQPIAFAADGFFIDALLAIARAPAKRLGALAADESFGLSPPQAVLHLDQTRIRIGAIEPLSRRRYVAFDGQLWLIEDAWYHHLFSTAERYLDPRPALDLGTPQRITTPRFQWRNDDGRWRRTPGDPSLGADHAQSLAERWAAARAVLVQPLDASAPWSGEIILEFERGLAPLVLRVAERGELVLLGRSDPAIQYQFTRKQAARLLSERLDVVE